MSSNDRHGPLVGFSTGALARGDAARGTAIAAAIAPPQTSALELSALHADELYAVSAARRSPAVVSFARVSVHAPVKGQAPPPAKLISALCAVCADVVCHPDAMVAHADGDVGLFEALGPALLIENNDGRKDYGAHPTDLAELFAALPAARMCLDVSHALHAGGWDLLAELIAAFGQRVAQLHVGCGCGAGTPLPLEAPQLDAITFAVAELGPLPIVIERAADTAASAELIEAYDAVAAAAGSALAP